MYGTLYFNTVDIANVLPSIKCVAGLNILAAHMVVTACIVPWLHLAKLLASFREHDYKLLNKI